MSICVKRMLEARPSLQGPRCPAFPRRDPGRVGTDTRKETLGGEGAPGTAGGGVRLQGGHRGTAHTQERETGTVSALGGAGSWKTALGCLTGLQARNSWRGGGVLYPSPIPHSVCSRHQQGSETLATLRLPGHSPETISVMQEGTSEAKKLVTGAWVGVAGEGQLWLWNPISAAGGVSPSH